MIRKRGTGLLIIFYFLMEQELTQVIHWLNSAYMTYAFFFMCGIFHTHKKKL